MKSAYIIYNPKAGKYTSIREIYQIVNSLNGHGWMVEAKQAISGENITTLSAQAANNECDFVFVAGGDGSYRYAAAALLGSNTAMAILPIGTSNVWAKDLRIEPIRKNWSRSSSNRIQQILNGNVYPIDVGICDNQIFLLWVGLGFDGYIVNEIEPLPRWSKFLPVLYYAFHILRCCWRWHEVFLEGETDSSSFSGQFTTGIVSNIRYFGGGKMLLSPKSTILDGVMEFWLLEGGTILDVYKHIFRLLAGTHVQSDRATCLPFSRMTVHSHQGIIAHIDGDPVIFGKNIDIRVIHNGLKMLIPEQSAIEGYR